MSTTIKSHYGKQLIVSKYIPGTVVFAHGPDGNGQPWKALGEAIFDTKDVLAALKDVGALPEPEGHTITDLPKVTESGGYLKSGDSFRAEGYWTSENTLKQAKELFAIGLELQKLEEAAKAEAKAAEEAAAKEAELEAKRHAEAELKELRRSVLKEHMYGLGFHYLPSYVELGLDKRLIVDALVTAKQAELKRLRESLAAV